jgi:two-component system sensor histidine kinase TctE
MDSGSHQLRRDRPQPPFSLLDSIREDRDGQAGRRAQDIDLGLESRCRDQNVPIHGKQMLIEEVLLNLLDNALRHTPAGGVITLRLYDAAPGGSDRAIFEIEDSGPGIQRAARTGLRTLPPAARRRPRRQRRSAAIVKDICRLHDIDISLHDGPQLGGLLVQLAFKR